MESKVDDNWFTIEQIDRDTFSISEYKHWEETHCYLLCGEKCAILIDTGLGVSNIKKIVDSLTELPVMAITMFIGITSAGISILIISLYMKRKRTGYQSGFRYRCKL